MVEKGTVEIHGNTLSVTKSWEVISVTLSANEMLALASQLLNEVNVINDTKFKVGHD